MKAWIKFFIENSKLTVVLSVFIFIFGLLGLYRTNAESYPAVDFAMATITTYYSGATADDIETKITRPIEDEIRTVSGLKDVKSTSQSGLSQIVVRVDMDNEVVEDVLEDLQKAVDRVNDLPLDLQERPAYQEINSEEFPAIELALTGPNKNRQRELLADQFKEELEDIKQVLNVRLVDYSDREFNIQLDQEKLNRYHLGVNEVINQVRGRNANIPGGPLRTSDIQKLVRIEGKAKNVEELENIVVRSTFTGNKIYLKDVAIIEDTGEEKTTRVRYNGEPATLLIVNKKAGADTIALVDQVEEKINRFRETHKDYELIVYNNEASKVKNKLDVLANNALSGLALVFLFLMIFLPGLIGIVASLSLPFAVLATMGFMPVMGINLNTITILALVIALGMLVDNAVVISENFTRLKKEGMNSKDAAIEAVNQLWLPITATAFTTIGAFLPMLVTKGIMGEFIKYIPIVVTLSLLISLIESFFLLPMRLNFVGKFIKVHKEGTNEANSDWFDKVILKFENFMSVMVKHRYIVLVGFMFLLVSSFILVFKINTFILFPAEQTEIYVGRLELPKELPLEKTFEKTQEWTKKIEQAFGDHISHITTRAGTSSMGPTDPQGETGDNVALALIYVNDQTKKEMHYTQVLDVLRNIKLEDAVSLQWQEQANGPPVGEPVNGTIRSNNDKELRLAVDEIKSKLSKVKGIFDVQDNTVVGNSEIFVDLDYQLIDRIGLNVNTVGETIRTALQGTVVSNVTINNKEVDYRVEYSDDFQKNIENLKSIQIEDNKGNLIPLDTIAKFREQSGTPQIKRFDFKRSKTVTANIKPEIINSQQANKELERIFYEVKKNYPSISLIFGGEGESTKESMESLAQAQVLALIAIFGILVFIFNSYIRPFIIMSTIPLGLVGFGIAFYLHQKPISFLALIGIVGLAGIIVNSGIVLISFIEQLREEGKLTLEEILVKASGMRLRAVMVTSLTTISGLFPTAYGIGGEEPTLIAMTLAMAWGLTSGTVLTLIWIPCFYAITEDINVGMGKIFNLKKSAQTANTNTESSAIAETSGS